MSTAREVSGNSPPTSRPGRDGTSGAGGVAIAAPEPSITPVTSTHVVVARRQRTCLRRARLGLVAPMSAPPHPYVTAATSATCVTDGIKLDRSCQHIQG
ncbi:hypothetical protein [Tsukamurella soli]|uniref:hypothetical protein n=1 Tax=Tsukamurella soli TaxID=644556 RepID=UPI003619E0B6